MIKIIHTRFTLHFTVCFQNVIYQLVEKTIKRIVNLFEIYSPSGDVDKFVFSSEQIWINSALHLLLVESHLTALILTAPIHC